MASPAKERVNLNADPASAPGLALMREYLSAGPANEQAYLEWKQHPITRLVVKAIMDLKDNPTTNDFDVNHILVQYGVSEGLSLAFDLMTYPQRVMPGVFSGPASKVDPYGNLDLGYVDSAESVLDNLSGLQNTAIKEG